MTITQSERGLTWTSRIMREYYVRFCERLGLKCPCLLGETGVTDVNTNRLRQIADLFKVSIVDMYSSDFTGLKSDDTLKIEELSEKLHQRESLLVDLQMKLLRYYEKKPTVINIG
ncbi:transcriptional regulator [Pedobacter sp. HMWF019]|uniref:transcriptional regulator n=1 Tax=Pedobacter sp. HMWF019 TaxID=2056856 RepID=UPI000D3377D6|nr:transcriptional regulator [Pedobacter sp. HMWF019]PTT01897.1 transcriptional regulator [Pedobacter sp. HMWF019]